MSFAYNPILRGSNPDPSIIRVGDDYYIATSTFEWFPGVQIHHSQDLTEWKLITRPLHKPSQLNLKGVPDSCGVWAPCLSYNNGIFYLVYTIVHSFDGVWKDVANYLITTKNILEEWSDPVFLSSSGFDGSLFHDDDGRIWYTSMLVDHRKKKFFGGITLQAYNPLLKKLVGPVTKIFEGTDLGYTEGPHLYKKDEYYYLITAEGGTEYGHAVTIIRSKNIEGPYGLHPANPFITSRDNPDSPLQKAGHADLLEDTDGNWYTVFLVARPLPESGRCILGRETALEKIIWKDGWPYLQSNTTLPRLSVAINDQNILKKNNAISFLDDFDQPELSPDFQSLRIPFDEQWISLKEKYGYLCLRGKESLSSTFEQSLIARRVQHFTMEASTSVDFYPDSFQQMAGLVLYYNTAHFHYLHITMNDDGNRCLQIITFDNFKHLELLNEPLLIADEGTIYLKASLCGSDLQFLYKTDNQPWTAIGNILDASILSDDYVQGGDSRYRPAFTGAFVGLCCQDLSGMNKPAFFDWFTYTEQHDDDVRFRSTSAESTVMEK